MAIDPLIARGGVPLDVTNTLAAIAEMRARDAHRNALIAQQQRELSYQQQQDALKQQQADAQDQAWNEGFAAFQGAKDDTERLQHLGALSRIDPQAAALIGRSWAEQKKQNEPPASLQIQQTPGPYGGTILSDGSRWQFVDAPRAPRGGGGRSSAGQARGGVSAYSEGDGTSSDMTKQQVKDAFSLRREFNNVQSVKDYKASLPVLISARRAPDTGAGDLAIIYAAGKILDPGSVVREGELQLTIGSGSPEDRVRGFVDYVKGNGGRMSPALRQKLLEMLNERVLSYRQLHDQERQAFGEYARQLGISENNVIGRHPADAFQGLNPGIRGGSSAVSTQPSPTAPSASVPKATPSSTGWGVVRKPR